ncbi:hypothetical protein J4221_05930 [Candidatus Pacearchaeota archaeon]|nr:hypothetical protein [Candidatus Pacearchaeota archaeon]
MRKITLADIILIILFLFAIALALWYLFGDSPTFEQIIIGFILPVIFGIAIKIAIIETRLNYIEKNIKEGFNRIKGDMNLIKNKLKIKS